MPSLLTPLLTAPSGTAPLTIYEKFRPSLNKRTSFMQISDDMMPQQFIGQILVRENGVSCTSAGRYTGSYRIPVFIFLTILIFKIPQYRCHLNNVWNATLLQRGLFSLLHFGEDTAVCVTKRESSETEALVECDERVEVIHNIHIDRHKYPPSAASAPASLTI